MLFLIHRTKESDRRASGEHAVLVDAESADEAYEISGAPRSWEAVVVAQEADMPPSPVDDGVQQPLRVLKFDSSGCTSLTGISRGGSRVRRDAKVV